MSEHENTHEPVDPVSGPQPTEAPDPSPAAPGPRWRDRAFRLRVVAAVAVAGVILGAAGGAVTTALVSDGRGDHGDHGDRHGPPFDRVGPPGQQPGMMPPGRVFPGQPPADQDDDTQDDTQDDTPDDTPDEGETES